MRMLHYLHRNIAVISITLSLNLMLLVSAVYAGGGIVSHCGGTVVALLSETPTLKGDAGKSGAKGVAVILYFRRDEIWQGGSARFYKKLYPELFRTALLPKDTNYEVIHSEAMMEKWANEFNSTTALAKLLKVLSLKEEQKRMLHDVATEFVLGCEIEVKELSGPVNPSYSDGRNARILEEMRKAFPNDDIFWTTYWVGVAQGLWTSAAVEVDRILTEGQKIQFETQLRKWQEANKTLLEETLFKEPKTSSDRLEVEQAKIGNRGADTGVLKVKENIDIRQCGHIPMQLDEAITILKESHLDMKRRNNSGEYYLALAIDPGDAETRQPTRFWIFDYNPITGHRWVTYPHSLPGIYTKLTSMTVNGHFPEEYLTENGDLISMRVSSDVIEHPSNPILIAYGSTRAELELRDDSGRNVKIVLSPQ